VRNHSFLGAYVPAVDPIQVDIWEKERIWRQERENEAQYGGFPLAPQHDLLFKWRHELRQINPTDPLTGRKVGKGFLEKVYDVVCAVSARVIELTNPDRVELRGTSSLLQAYLEKGDDQKKAVEKVMNRLEESPDFHSWCVQDKA
jgi:hypothetical protein